jgi:hypothetical protein
VLQVQDSSSRRLRGLSTGTINIAAAAAAAAPAAAATGDDRAVLVTFLIRRVTHGTPPKDFSLMGELGLFLSPTQPKTFNGISSAILSPVLSSLY